MEEPIKYTMERGDGKWWHIKKGIEAVGFVSSGSYSKYYCMHLNPILSVGTGYQTSQDAFNAYVKKYPLNP
jgi:hypothetical protein